MKLPNILVISNFSASVNSIRPEAEIFIKLSQQGFRVFVMTPADSFYAEKCRQNGIEIIDYRAKRKWDLHAIKLIRSVVKRESIHVVQAFNGKGISNAAMALIGLKCKLVAYRGYSGNIHWYDPTCYIHYLHPRVDVMICLAESIRQLFLKNGMPRKKPITIHKGHDPSWYADVQKADLQDLDIPNDALKCAFVANNRIRMKGVLDLMDALFKLPAQSNVHLLMIGRGLDQPEVLEKINDLKLQKQVHFIGFSENANAIVKACDLSISVSVYGEATQKAMIEAMFMAKAAIMSDIPGNRGMLIDGEGGFVVKAGDADSIANALEDFWLMSPEDRQQMGQSAQRHIHSFLNHQKTVKEYAELYTRISVH